MGWSCRWLLDVLAPLYASRMPCHQMRRENNRSALYKTYIAHRTSFSISPHSTQWTGLFPTNSKPSLFKIAESHKPSTASPLQQQHVARSEQRRSTYNKRPVSFFNGVCRCTFKARIQNRTVNTGQSSPTSRQVGVQHRSSSCTPHFILHLGQVGAGSVTAFMPKTKIKTPKKPPPPPKKKPPTARGPNDIPSDEYKRITSPDSYA